MNCRLVGCLRYYLKFKKWSCLYCVYKICYFFQYIYSSLFGWFFFNIGRSEDLSLKLQDGTLKVNPDDFIFVIREIIGNAFRFSNPGTKVEIIAENNDKNFEIQITDYGLGLQSDNLSEIDLYSQFDRRKGEEGTGIGLITAMLVIQRHRGTIDVVNEKMHTRVVVKWPCCLGK